MSTLSGGHGTRDNIDIQTLYYQAPLLGENMGALGI